MTAHDKIVLDTNVVLDWLIYEDARVRRLADAFAHRQLTLVSDPLCLAELEDVVHRPVIRATAEQRDTSLRRYCEIAEWHPIEPAPADLPKCRDPDDQKFIELAVRAGAKVIVTRDKELLRLHHALVRRANVQVLETSCLGALLEGLL